jgi:YYY domain-containing protein
MTLETALQSDRLNKWVIRSLLVVVLLAGLSLRVWNINFDNGMGSHPDERSTACFYATRIALPKSWSELSDPKRSPLNPLWDLERQEARRFTYGHFPLYLGVGMGNLLHFSAPAAAALGIPPGAVELMERANSACSALAVAGRLTIALLDTLTLLLLYFLARRMFGRWTALLAVGFYAFTAQAIQLSHFFAMDPASTTFTVMAVLGGVMMVQERTIRAVVVCGVGAGLAVASKFSALPILAVPVTAGLLLLLAARQRRDGRVDASSFFVAIFGPIAAIALAVLTFFITSPYAILDWQNFSQATLVEQGQMVRGFADFPFTRQYRNTTPYVYFLEQQLRWGMWWPLGIAAGLGAGLGLLALVRTLVGLLRGRAIWRLPGEQMQFYGYEMANVLIWSWVIPYFGLTGAFLAKFNRYMSPLLPFGAIFAAALFWWFYHLAKPKERSLEPEGAPAISVGRAWMYGIRAGAIAGALVVLVASAFWSLAYVNGVYGREHTWITASRWLYQNAPAGSVILWELWDDPLPKSIPNEPGMDMGSTNLRNIDWSPYEEDTFEKYQILKEKLLAADFVAYSSKRIYGSVAELPERYPMTNLYYASMWDGRLGFEMALDLTAPPSLFGFVFEDRHADESWSLYDHPQVTIFHKVRQLSEAEFDAIFAGSWEGAIPYYVGQGSALSPLLEWLGLGGTPQSSRRGMVSWVINQLTGRREMPAPVDASVRPSLMIEQPLAELTVVDDYRWNDFASRRSWAAVAMWWATGTLLGWLAFPICFLLLGALRDRGYFLARAVGWLLPAWLLWFSASYGVLHNTVRNSWMLVLLLALVGGIILYRQRAAIRSFVRESFGLLLLGELLFAAAFGLFVLLRMVNPDLWQPWFGGEKFMEFAFINGILRSPTFPPVDPHFAGGIINYYYFGLFLAAFYFKLTGIYAEVGFNLVIPYLFALTVLGAFCIAYNGWPRAIPANHWRQGLWAALLGPFFVALVGNLEGFGQIARQLASRSPVQVQSAIPGVPTIVGMWSGLANVLRGEVALPAYDFWGPSRVIPYSINEFPYWSFLFADLHPHLIGIPFALLFLAVLLAFMRQCEQARNVGLHTVLVYCGVLAFLLGTLASINLWEIPTYALLAGLAILVMQVRWHRRVKWGLTVGSGLLFVGGAFLLYLPFLSQYVNVGASGIGLVRTPDSLTIWLQVWALFVFVCGSWLLIEIRRSPRSQTFRQARLFEPSSNEGGVTVHAVGAQPQRGEVEMSSPGGGERFHSLVARKFDRLPRLVYLHQKLVQEPTVGYLLNLWWLPLIIGVSLVALWLGFSVFALCVLLFGLSWLLLFRRGSGGDSSSQFVALLFATGAAVLAGTQVVYLKDFLQGGDWYRMNTLFKFFIQVWVIWGIACAIALPQIWSLLAGKRKERRSLSAYTTPEPPWAVEPGASGMLANTDALTYRRWLPAIWRVACVVLIVLSSSYLIFGTPARLSERLIGWQPPFGTLDGLAFMEKGSYTWPNDGHRIELAYDVEAIRWLLDSVRGNAVVLETAEVDYYRAGSTRVASFTGLSGLRGMHASEQRYGDEIGERSRLHQEIWSTDDIGQTEALLVDLEISLIYVSQLERHLHPEGVAKFAGMAEQGNLDILYENPGVVIYAVPGRLQLTTYGYYVPSVRDNDAG